MKIDGLDLKETTNCLVDSREPKSMLIAIDREGTLEYEVCNLTSVLTIEDEGILGSGDYLVGVEDNGKALYYLIERKTVADFIGSSLDRSLTFQLERMRAITNYFSVIKFTIIPFLLIEGSDSAWRYHFKQHRLNEKARSTIKNRAVVDYGVGIIETGSKAKTAEFLRSLIEERPDNEIIARRKGHGNKSIRQIKADFLQGIPGIGPKSSGKLLDSFDNDLQEIIRVLTADLISDPAKERNLVRKALGKAQFEKAYDFLTGGK